MAGCVAPQADKGVERGPRSHQFLGVIQGELDEGLLVFWGFSPHQ